jgi:hypothetical protein
MLNRCLRTLRKDSTLKRQRSHIEMDLIEMGCVIDTMDRLKAGCPGIVDRFIQGQEFCLFSKISRPALGATENRGLFAGG